MRFAIIFTLAAASAASASVISGLVRRQEGIPACAIPCLTETPTGACGPDNVCLCKDKAFVAATTTCIRETCKGDDIATAEAASREACRAVGVTLTETAFSSTASAPETESAAPETTSATSVVVASTTTTSTSGTATVTAPSGSGGSSSAPATTPRSSSTSPTAAGSSSASAPASSSTGGAISRGISTAALLGAVAIGAFAL